MEMTEKNAVCFHILMFVMGHQSALLHKLRDVHHHKFCSNG